MRPLSPNDLLWYEYTATSRIKVRLKLPRGEMRRVLDPVRAAQLEVAVDEGLAEAVGEGRRRLQLIESLRQHRREGLARCFRGGDGGVVRIVHVQVGGWRRRHARAHAIEASGANGGGH